LLNVVYLVLKLEDFRKGMFDIGFHIVDSVTNSLELVESHIQLGAGGVGLGNQILKGLFDGIGLGGLETSWHRYRGRKQRCESVTLGVAEQKDVGGGGFTPGSLARPVAVSAD
jgi:hypothetical protein